MRLRAFDTTRIVLSATCTVKWSQEKLRYVWTLPEAYKGQEYMKGSLTKNAWTKLFTQKFLYRIEQ